MGRRRCFQAITATFTIVATGLTSLHYQWQRNGTNLISANSSVLVLTNVLASDAGQYSVVVENLSGSVASSLATLTVLTHPPTYRSTAATDVTNAPVNTFIPLAGQALYDRSGSPATNVEVWVHIVRDHAFARVLKTRTSADGRFAVTFHPFPNEAGFYEVYATAPDAARTQAQDTFVLYGLRLEPAAVTHMLSGQSTLNNCISLDNLSTQDLGGVSALVLSNDRNLEVAVVVPPMIPALSTVPLCYTLTSRGRLAWSGRLTVSVDTLQGYSVQLPMDITVLASPPMLEIIGTVQRGFQLLLYGEPGVAYEIWQSTELGTLSSPWLLLATVTPTNGVQEVGHFAPANTSCAFFRVARTWALPADATGDWSR